MRNVFLIGFACCTLASALGSGGGCGGAGGGGGFCGFGDSSGFFELPKVEEDVEVGGVTLKVNRTKWGYSVFATSGDGPLAQFVGEDIEVTLRRIDTPPHGGRLLVQALSSQDGVLYARSVSTSGAMRGVKAAYGVRRGFASSDQTTVRYFLNVPGRNWLCFEARATGKAPQWQEANDFVLGARLDRSRS